MSQPLSEYFSQEAGEFLDQLDALLAPGGAPDAERFFRVARGVRGSAQIGGVPAVVGVAERLEDAARALREGTLRWSEELRVRAMETAADLRTLVAAVPAWGSAEDERAARALARWGDEPAHRDAGTAAAEQDLVAFVRREVGAIVAELDRVIAGLAEDPTAREPLRVLLRRMRPVRGVTGHPALAPVLEVLEGVEDACGDMLGRTGPAGAAPLGVLRSARDALLAATDLLGAGAGLEAMPELESFRAARDRLDGEQPGDAEVIPVSRLFTDEPGAHIVASPTAPVQDLAGDGLQDDVERFVRIEATGFLDRAEGLIAESEADPRRRLGRIARQLADLSLSVHELAATYGLARIAAAAEDAATRLRRAGSHAEAREALRGLRTALPGGAADSVPPPSPAPAAPAEASPSPAAEPAMTHPAPAAADDAIPVETLLYAPEDALEEAFRLRSRIEGMVGPAGRVGAPLGDVLDELFGLLTLARSRPTPG